MHASKLKSSLSPARLLLCLLLVCGKLQAQVDLEVLETHPGFLPVIEPLTVGQTFYIRLGYQTDNPVKLYTTASFDGDVVDVAGKAPPTLPAGNGEYLASVVLMSPGAIDKLRFSFRESSSSTETLLLELPVAVTWALDGLLTDEGTPEWVERLNQVAEQQMAEELLAQQSPSLLWNLFLTIIVIAVPASIAWLSWAASRHWKDYWRLLAAIPLLVLLLWSAFIVLEKLVDPGSHRLWPFEIFIWGMATVVYLVVLMTAKKTFDKADAEQTKSS